MDLSFVDLIKNKVFRNFNTTHPDDFAKTKWKKLRDTIVSRDSVGSLEKFVRYWWIARYDYTSNDNIYKYFKKRWNSGEIDAETFLEELVDDATLYVKICSPVVEDFKQQEEQELYRSLTALKIFEVETPRPFILNLFKAKQSKQLKLVEIKETLEFIEKFHFSFNKICSLRPSGIGKTYFAAAKQLLEATDKHSARNATKELITKLKTRLPEKEKFKAGFSKLIFLKGKTTHKKLIQYIFNRFEVFKQTTNEFKPDNITLEHILSQSSGSSNCIGLIGNLLPLSAGLNEKADNKPFKEKIEIYKKSNYALTQEFVQNIPEKWGEEEIQFRTNSLAEEFYDLMWGTNEKK